MKGLVSPMVCGGLRAISLPEFAGGINYIPGMNGLLTVNFDHLNTVIVGDTPEHAVKYGLRIYVPMKKSSNLLRVSMPRR